MTKFGSVSTLSQVFRFADYVNEIFPEHALRILRKRIILPQGLSVEQKKIEQEVTKVVAKRISFGEVNSIEMFFEQHLQLYPKASDCSENGRPPDPKFVRGSKNGFKIILAEALDSDEKSFIVTQNLPQMGAHFHAEVILLERLMKSKKAVNVKTIRVSLKPCRMCAALIYAAQKANLLPSLDKIVFLEHDPGPMASETLLDAYFDLKRIGSEFVYKVPSHFTPGSFG